MCECFHVPLFRNKTDTYIHNLATESMNVVSLLHAFLFYHTVAATVTLSDSVEAVCNDVKRSDITLSTYIPS